MNINLKYVSILFTMALVYSEDIHRRFEYKYSFKGPYLAQKDNSIPFWEYSGHAIASSDRLRITPSLRSHKGQAWCKNPINFQWWSAEIIFRINGGGTGADGMAFWYTSNKGVEGPVFGSSDKWNGFGLFFDSFDNDQKRNNPYIMGMLNDGTQVFQHESDGHHQKMGGCLRNFRNKAIHVRAKIEYYKNVLTVFYHSGDSDKEEDYEICFRSENVFLPPSGYFGLTAATGDLADDHDVLKFLVQSLRPMEEMAHIQRTEEYEKYQKEYEEYERKTKQARDEYLAQHPEAKPPSDQTQYLTPEQMMYSQLTETVVRVNNDIRNCLLKLDQVVGKQEQILSLVSGGSYVSAPAGRVDQGQLPSGSGDGINNVLAGQRELLQEVRSLKMTSSDIHGFTQQILNRAQGSVQPVGAGGSYEMNIILKELKDDINFLKNNLHVVTQRLGDPNRSNAIQCPEVKCTSTWVLVMLLIGQLAVLLCYFIYRDSKENRAKKFY